MALANSLATAGFTATSVHSNADVHLGKDDTGFLINLIELTVTAVVPNVDSATFQQHVEKTKVGCIIKRALAAVPTDREGDAEELGARDRDQCRSGIGENSSTDSLERRRGPRAAAAARGPWF